MSRTITRLFDTHVQAVSAVENLERSGVDHDRISIVSSNADNWHDGARPFAAGSANTYTGGPLGDANHDGENDVADGAGKGAARGGVIGGAGGLLAGLGMLAIPGLGPVVAAGWLASTAVGAVVGAVAGGAAGGLLGALKEAGHSDEEANVYAEGVRRGGTLVSVKADDEDAGRIESLLNGGVDAATRGDAYRQQGWTGFDDTAAPYSVDDISRERALYATGESRSFGVQDDRDDDLVDPDGPRSTTDAPLGTPRQY
ncbi:MAG: hypothetical protein JWR84_1004 [Caulobacter sp.]|nr:hypothetical protein [Caulobacter sp.]